MGNALLRRECVVAHGLSLRGMVALAAVLAACVWASPSRAQDNATRATNSDIVRTTSQSASNIIGGRISFLTGTSGSNGSGNPNSGGTTGGGSQNGGQGSSGGGQGPSGGGIPVPAKDVSALSSPFEGGFVPQGSSKTLFATASDGKATGLSAGDPLEAARLALWTMGSVSWISNLKSGARFNGNIATMLGGVDYRFTPKLMAGVAAGYQGTDLTTSYNNGWNKNAGAVVMPYASYSILDNLVADAAFGLTPNRYETSSIPPSQGETRTGYDALRVLQTTNLSYYLSPKGTDWTFTFKAGNLLSNEHSYGISASDTFLGELSVGAKAAYRWRSLTVSGGATYLYDYAAQGLNDRDEVQATLGMMLQMNDRLSLSLDGYNSFFRDNFRNSSLNATLRAEF